MSFYTLMMVNKKRLFLAIGLAGVIGISAFAVPAYPRLIKTTQPDGTTIEIYPKGDEHFHWAETPDGYTLLQDAKGFWTFANVGNGGEIVASDLKFTGSSQPARLKGVKPGLKAPARAAADKAGLQVEGTFPTKGKRRLLLLLINYADKEPIYSREDFENFMNQTGYRGIGSFRDYYLSVSYNQLDVTTTVTPWITLSHDKSYYGANGGEAMVLEALDKLGDAVNLRDFDNDGDGILDGLAVIHQGYGQEYTLDRSDIWSYSSMFVGRERDGVTLSRYTVEPELLRDKQMSNIGVICHEFGHNLGAPDFYDTDYGTNGEYPGTGKADLMGSGAWNGDSGTRPAGINLWQKTMCGWVEPTLLDKTTTITNMQQSLYAPEAYRINTTVANEFFLLENRQKIGPFDQALPGHGMLIYHIDENRIRKAVYSNTLNSQFPMSAYVVCASSGSDPIKGDPSSYGDLTGPGQFFPGTAYQTEFSDYTKPSCKSISGRMSYFSIKNIKESQDGLISFDFIQEEAPAKPVNLVAEAAKGIVTLKWDLPANSEMPEYFTIYRNGEKLANTESMTYRDSKVPDSYLIQYSVDATYADGRISPYSEVGIHVPSNKTKKLDLAVKDNDVVLHWTLDNILTRMLNYGTFNDYATNTYNSTSLEYAHRYTADDLSCYVGSVISRIGFWPYQGPQDISFKMRIWEADADGSNPTVVSERNVKEFGMGVWRELKLTTPVTIRENKEYWIGIYAEPKAGMINILSDIGPVISGRGNMIRKAGKDWEEDMVTVGNYYIDATLEMTESNSVVEIGNYPGKFDPVSDALFPIGFKVYRDGNFLGQTSSRYFIDRDAPNGRHEYSVSCLYKGDNESDAIKSIITKDESYLESITNNNVIRVTYDGIEIDAAAPVSVVNMAGVTLYNSTVSGNHSVSLPAGIYIVKTAASVNKVVVR